MFNQKLRWNIPNIFHELQFSGGTFHTWQRKTTMSMTMTKLPVSLILWSRVSGLNHLRSSYEHHHTFLTSPASLHVQILIFPLRSISLQKDLFSTVQGMTTLQNKSFFSALYSSDWTERNMSSTISLSPSYLSVPVSHFTEDFIVMIQRMRSGFLKNDGLISLVTFYLNYHTYFSPYF